MAEKHLHIISMDVPYPADYGGVIDVYFKIKALWQQGISIHLHCFDYGRNASDELQHYCTEVRYYSRKRGHQGISHNMPYIVCSRANESMLNYLLQDEYPILIEGIHCTYLLTDRRFMDRKIFLRLHNTEYLYYRQLFTHENSPFKKAYYWFESRLLRRYERLVAGKCQILAMSDQDVKQYQHEFHAVQVRHLPAFVASSDVRCSEGCGCYCLYHGNLSVAENERAAIWLLRSVFNDLGLPLVIAGHRPSARLARAVHLHDNTCLVADPSDQEMQDIVAKAQVHVLPSFNVTGIKFKLLNALFNGRHCVTNEAAVAGTGLESTCRVCSGEQGFKQAISQAYSQEFSDEDRKKRAELLGSRYDNQRTAEQLIAWIW